MDRRISFGASVDPAVVGRLAVVVVRTEYDELEPVGASLEPPRHLGRDPNRVQRPDLEDLIVELDIESLRPPPS